MKEIKLNGKHGTEATGRVCLVDDEDYEWLNQWNWYANNPYKDIHYAVRTKTINGKVSYISMHREILKLTDSKLQADHIDHNGLNNQRSNLRIATGSQNCANRRKIKVPTTSKYKGVIGLIKKGKQVWLASYLTENGIRATRYSSNEAWAAHWYNLKVKERWGEFAVINDIPLNDIIGYTEKEGRPQATILALQGIKKCNMCKEIKSIEAFNAYKGKIEPKCIPCMGIYHRKKWEEHKDKWNENRRKKK